MTEQIDGPITHFIALVLVASFLPMFITGFIHWISFDRLVWYEYKNHPEQWESDGKPTGTFWRPRGKFDWRQRAKLACMQSWLKVSPEWMSIDAKASGILSTYRRSKNILDVTIVILGGMLLLFLIGRHYGI